MSTNANSNPFQLIFTRAAELHVSIKSVSIEGSVKDLKLDLQHTVLSSLNSPAESSKADAFLELTKRIFLVQFVVSIRNEKETLKMDIVYHVAFECQDPITEEFLNSPMVRINAAAIAFPFVRSFVTTITSNAGIPPIYLPSINFAKLQTQDIKSAPLTGA